MAYTTRRNNNGPVLRSNAPATSHRSSFASVTSATSISPSRSISSIPVAKQLETPKRTCMCSPTSHPGSFRCSLHKKQQTNSSSTTNSSIVNSNSQTASYPSSRLNARRSAMTNSLVRIGTVEGGDLVKRALAALIRPSSHQQRRRGSFQARPSRLSVMSKDEDVFA
ncbi:serine-rich protein-related protein [Artemisia annua]|uniref:Serine-rich protein-related protein n=1 Tax=Artemisia annua TaxID=35608 RepID=A0A2U1MD21_ARTAN|nr:serine-rich protein-related protein [Artemisia annua]